MDKFIFLYGAPASGKTTLGKALAQALDCPAADLDELIVRQINCPIAEFFQTHGEAAFREVESQILGQVVSGNCAVISLGGGTLLREENRQLCEKHGTVLCLDTPAEAELAKRLNLAPGVRPLGNQAASRQAHYASFPRRIAATFQLPGSLVMAGEKLSGVFLEEKQTIYDARVAEIYGIHSPLGLIPSGEKYKTPATVMHLWECFQKGNLGRKDYVSACGGGVTGDLTGFAAATWMRGMAWRNFPTTLLAMLDASVGGKTGCDLPYGKNLAGAFHAPKIVVIDRDFLHTLPDRELRSGMGEYVKHQILGGGGINLPSGLPARQEIAANLAVKVDIVRQDPLEKNLRMKLNCGHTVGHAAEAFSNYTLSHGEAVAMGCLAEARLAVKLNLAPAKWPEELKEVLINCGLNPELPNGMTFEKLIPLMRNDKKRQGNTVTFALPCTWGDVRLVPIELKA